MIKVDQLYLIAGPCDASSVSDGTTFAFTLLTFLLSSSLSLSLSISLPATISSLQRKKRHQLLGPRS